MNDHYIKINKCIDSSKTKTQFESCEKLISNFKKLFFNKRGKDCEYTKKLVENMFQLQNMTATWWIVFIKAHTF